MTEATSSPGPTAAREGRSLAAACLLLVAGVAACDHIRVTVPGDGGEPGGGSWSAVAAGATHTCGLSGSGRAYCWGADGRGQLGAGGAVDTSAAAAGCPGPCAVRPLAVDAAAAFDTLVAGDHHTCALTGSGEAWCWGANGRGQLGDSTLVDRARPVRVAGGHTFASLAAGGDHTCGVTRVDRFLFCWGDDFWGQLGRGTRSTTPVREPRFVLRDAVQVDAGRAHTCAVVSGDELLYCWGRNDRGQLGLGYLSDVPETSPVLVLTRAVSVSAGGQHTCALSPADSTARCWGWNDEGAAGLGAEGDYVLDPSRVAGGRSYGLVSAGGGHTCAVDTGRGLFCWGDDLTGQVGTGAAGGTVPSPASVDPARRFRAVAAGAADSVVVSDPPADDLDGVRAAAHTCAVDGGGELLCWGANGHGQLGDGTVADRPAPVQVSAPGGG